MNLDVKAFTKVFTRINLNIKLHVFVAMRIVTERQIIFVSVQFPKIFVVNQIPNSSNMTKINLVHIIFNLLK